MDGVSQVRTTAPDRGDFDPGVVRHSFHRALTQAWEAAREANTTMNIAGILVQPDGSVQIVLKPVALSDGAAEA